MADAVLVPGEPLDPALGFPRAVVYQKVRNYWFELVWGLSFVVVDLGIITGFIHDESKPEIIVLGFVFGAIVSPLLIFDGFRNIRRRPCLIVAANGFDDRTGWRPVGPVLWSEVASMQRKTRNLLHSSYPILVITLVAGQRRPLTPLGKSPRQVSKVTIPMEQGNDRLIMPAIYSSYQEWLQLWGERSGSWGVTPS